MLSISNLSAPAPLRPGVQPARSLPAAISFELRIIEDCFMGGTGPGSMENDMRPRARKGGTLSIEI